MSETSSVARLKESLQILNETESIANETLCNLHKQKSTIINTTNTSKKINENLSTSHNIINRIAKWWHK
jgi:hypothetical protein